MAGASNSMNLRKFSSLQPLVIPMIQSLNQRFLGEKKSDTMGFGPTKYMGLAGARDLGTRLACRGLHLHTLVRAFQSLGSPTNRVEEDGPLKLQKKMGGFPQMGTPSHHPFLDGFNGIFHQPIHFGVPGFVEPPG